ncbi:Saposin B-type domain-containing protein [Mycena sanguinolenta]|uniref:Saposin B-type domain-containing protein n=1 Tax=Mycena sanguinolenta TaxID=230812 RepID=A0A8H6Z7T1_9AGAR|nr:Saposin B-type domain-containing protein [Mycena sanguinolenta]
MSAAPTLPPLDGTLGAVAIGAIVSPFLLGIEALQAYHYFNKYPEDSLFLKSMVAVLWLFELGHMISTGHVIYAITVTYYGQLQHLQTPPHSLEMTIFFHGCIILVVQSFFANRVRVFSGKWLIPVICWTMTALRVVATFAMMGIEWMQPNIQTLQIKFRWLLTASISLGMTIDTVITLSMCYWLWQVRHSRFGRTKTVINTLLVWTVETGVATCVSGAMFLILVTSSSPVVSFGTLTFWTSSSSVVVTVIAWFPFYLVQGKLYSNSLLFSLNGRKRLRGSGKFLEISAGSTTLEQNVSERNRRLVIEMSEIVETDGSMSKDLEHGRNADLRG